MNTTNQRNRVHEFVPPTVGERIRPPTTWDIPVPPYDKELPLEYWESLKTAVPKPGDVGYVAYDFPTGWDVPSPSPKPAPPLETGRCTVMPPPPPARATPSSSRPGMGDMLGALIVMCAFLAICWFFSLFSHQPSPPSPETAPAAAARLTLKDMIPGNQYWVDLPDGRHIKINYQGYRDYFSQLPVQPAGGANNAAYRTYDGSLWIWTVPVGPSNIPQWIDP